MVSLLDRDFNTISISNFRIRIKKINDKITQRQINLDMLTDKIKETQSEIRRMKKDFETLQIKTQEFRLELKN